jgi:hypothetical protein
LLGIVKGRLRGALAVVGGVAATAGCETTVPEGYDRGMLRALLRALFGEEVLMVGRVVGVAAVIGALIAAPIAPVRGAEITRVTLHRAGAIVSAGELRGDIWINTELSASSEAAGPNQEPTPFLWFSQAAYTYDPTIEAAVELLWSAHGSTTEFDMDVARDLSTLHVIAADIEISRCDAAWSCVGQSESLEALFTAVGPTLRSHQQSVASVSRQSLFVAHSVGAYRFASAAVTVGGDTYATTADPTSANIYDTQNGHIEASFVPFGHASALGQIQPMDTGAPIEGIQAVSAVGASWEQWSDEIYVGTYLGGSSRQIRATGEMINVALAWYYEGVYALDEWGGFQTVMETYAVEGATADSVVVDSRLRSGSMTASAVAAVTCTYIEGEAYCLDVTLSISGAWTGKGDITKTRDGNRAGVAGHWQWVYLSSASTRDAAADVSVGGVSLGPSASGRLDTSRTGFRMIEVTPGG